MIGPCPDLAFFFDGLRRGFWITAAVLSIVVIVRYVPQLRRR